MTFDLRRGLREVGDLPSDQDVAVPAGRLLRRVHRRRAVRSTAYAVASVGTAAAVVLGGVTALHHAHQAAPPAVEQSPTVSPSPTSDASSTPVAPAIWSIPWGRCGQAVAPDPGTNASSPVSVRLDERSVVDVGALFSTVGHVLSTEPGARTIHVQVLGLTVAREAVAGSTSSATGDWTVVGLGGVDPGPGTDVTTSGTTSDGFPVASRFVTCDNAPAPGGASTDTLPLGAGTYGLFVSVRTTTSTGGTSLVTTGPLPLTIVDPGAPATPTHGAPVTGDPLAGGPRTIDVLQPGCGARYPTPFAGPGGIVTMTGEATVAADGSAVTLTATDTNTGVAIASGWATDASLVLLRDGIVVARTPDGPVVPFVLAGWDVGATITRTTTLPTTTCVALDPAHPVGSRLPSGTYQLVAVQSIARSTAGAAGINATYGGPWTVALP